MTTCEEYKEAGIEPSLINYFTFFGKGTCKNDCPMYSKCVLVDADGSARSYVKRIEKMTGRGVVITCPFILYDEGDELETIELRDVSLKQAKDEILKYYDELEGKVAYPSDVSLILRLDLELTMKAVEELISEGELGDEEK